MYHVSCIMYHVSCIMYHVSCIMYHLTFHVIWHFMSFDISCHFTFHVIWHFMSFEVFLREVWRQRYSLHGEPGSRKELGEGRGETHFGEGRGETHCPREVLHQQGLHLLLDCHPDQFEFHKPHLYSCELSFLVTTWYNSGLLCVCAGAARQEGEHGEPGEVRGVCHQLKQLDQLWSIGEFFLFSTNLLHSTLFFWYMLAWWVAWQIIWSLYLGVGGSPIA